MAERQSGAGSQCARGTQKVKCYDWRRRRVKRQGNAMACCPSGRVASRCAKTRLMSERDQAGGVPTMGGRRKGLGGEKATTIGANCESDKKCLRDNRRTRQCWRTEETCITKGMLDFLALGRWAMSGTDAAAHYELRGRGGCR